MLFIDGAFRARRTCSKSRAAALGSPGLAFLTSTTMDFYGVYFLVRRGREAAVAPYASRTLSRWFALRAFSARLSRVRLSWCPVGGLLLRFRGQAATTESRSARVIHCDAQARAENAVMQGDRSYRTSTCSSGATRGAGCGTRLELGDHWTISVHRLARARAPLRGSVCSLRFASTTRASKSTVRAFGDESPCCAAGRALTSCRGRIGAELVRTPSNRLEHYLNCHRVHNLFDLLGHSLYATVSQTMCSPPRPFRAA